MGIVRRYARRPRHTLIIENDVARAVTEYRPYGVVLAEERDNGEVWVGWSLAVKSDTFNRKTANLIGQNRLNTGRYRANLADPNSFWDCVSKFPENKRFRELAIKVLTSMHDRYCRVNNPSQV